ncbi:MAG TPA: hypothetical protein VH518_14170 [Tepidisphaeraceae bacterium]|jgi:hypothetical protein
MPGLSRWIIGYGLLLLASNLVDSFGPVHLGLQGRTMISGWAGGVLMIAAGLASAQGRRSIRLGGLYVGVFLPLAMAGIFAWRAAVVWRTGEASHFAAWALSFLALTSIILVAIVIHQRPREGIASRGYAVSLTAPKTEPHETAADESPRHSEAR